MKFIKDWGAFVAVILAIIAGVAKFSRFETKLELMDSSNIETITQKIENLEENAVLLPLNMKSTKSIEEIFDNKKQSLSSIPIGSIVPFAGPRDKIPEYWMLCNGKALQVSQFAELYNVIGTAWGGTDKTYFNLPNLQGYFLRGVDNEAQNDPDASKREPSNAGGNKGNKIGTVQGDATKMPNKPFVTNIGGEHFHNDPTWNTKPGNYELDVSLKTGGYDYKSQSAPTSKAGSHKHKITGGDNETRPRNAYVNFIIKVK